MVLSVTAQQFPPPYLDIDAQRIKNIPEMNQVWGLARGYAGIEYHGNWNLMTYELNKQAAAILKLAKYKAAEDFNPYIMKRALNKHMIYKRDGTPYAINFRKVLRYYKRKKKN